MACGVWEYLASRTAMQRTGLAFLFALETAMRSGEILALTPEHIHAKERWVHIPKSKNGDERDVPLTRRAVEILEALPPSDGGPVFNVKDATRDKLFRDARDAAKLFNLHFHDSRAEAIWRLSKKLDVLELARVIGHRDINSLLIYYSADASEMAARLD
jgi:integrase